MRLCLRAMVLSSLPFLNGKQTKSEPWTFLLFLIVLVWAPQWSITTYSLSRKEYSTPLFFLYFSFLMNCFIFQYKYTWRKDCPICKTKYSRLQSLQLVIRGQQWSKIIFLFFTALRNQTCLFISKKNTFLLLWFPLTAFSPSDNFAVMNTHTFFRRKILQNYWYSNLTIRTSRN